MSLTYTFPADYHLSVLRGLTATGGKFTTVLQQGKRVDAIAFENRVQGKKLIVIVAGKPELEALLSVHKADQVIREVAADPPTQTLQGQREVLVRNEHNTYSLDHWPGSAEWKVNKRAADALAAFDAAHPEVKAAEEAERRTAENARYAALSDFAKRGS